MARQRKKAAAMPLIEHLRELRRRLVISVIALAIAFVPGWLLYKEVFALLRAPFDSTVASMGHKVALVLPGVMDPFSLQMQVAGLTAAILSSPVWLTQLWRFITPGLHRKEKMWTYLFLLAALPLMAAGMWLCYNTLPMGLQLLLGMTPDNVQNFIAVDRYIDFVVKMALAFAIGFLSPLVLVLLNFARVLSAAKIRSWWRGMIMMVLLFAAVATPTGDPINMMLLALPIMALLVLAWAIAAIHDRVRRKKEALEPQWDDDEASDLDTTW